MPFPLEEEFIVKAEACLGVKFPVSFREKMKEENGGEVSTPPDVWFLYPFFDSSDRKRIKRTTNHIVLETENAKKWNGFPEDAVAIGSNGGGDQLVFLKENDTFLRSEVYWWDHETGEINKVAEDFSEL